MPAYNKMTVTPEERIRMRQEINEDSNVVHYCVKPEHMLELLDTMDEVEFRADKAEADKSDLFDEAVRQNKRAIQAERERDALAEALAWGIGKENRSIFDKLPFCDSKQKWLDWAAQKAAKVSPANDD